MPIGVRSELQRTQVQQNRRARDNASRVEIGPTDPNSGRKPGDVPNKEVAVPWSGYLQMEDDWRLVRALMGGTRAMREAGEEYLPMEPGESKEAWEHRLARTTLFNAYRRTVRRLAGRPYAKAMKLNENVPAKIKEWAKDIDRNGTDIDSFCKSWLEDAIAAGISHVYVDFPPLPTDTAGNPVRISAADERAQDRRPYWTHVKGENLIGVRYRREGGRYILTQIRIEEWVSEDDGEFGEVVHHQVRVIEETKFRLFRATEDENGKVTAWVEGKSGVNTLGKIPLVTLYATRLGFQIAEPPLMDLAWMNVDHWRSSSDQSHILHVYRVPILYGAGLARAAEDDEDTDNPQGAPVVEIGPNRMFFGPAGSTLEFVTGSAETIEAGRQHLIDAEDRMTVMGLRMETKQQAAGPQTATGEVLDTAESESELHGIVTAQKGAIELAFDYMAQWAKIGDDGGEVEINKDFGISARDAQEIDVLLRSRIAGELTRESYLSELQRRGVLSDAIVVSEESEKLDREKADNAPDFANPGAPGMPLPRRNGNNPPKTPPRGGGPGNPPQNPPQNPRTTGGSA